MEELPEVALVPLQAPEAVQEVALVELQVSVELPLEATEVGEADRETVGVVEEPFLSYVPAVKGAFLEMPFKSVPTE